MAIQIILKQKGISWRQNKQSYAIFICFCGKEKKMRTDVVKRGAKSCGCMAGKLIKHGMSNNRFYKIHSSMKRRCNVINNKDYLEYGGRGIKCEWKSFEEFKKDMYQSYEFHVKRFGEKQTTLDRIDVNGNYCKENCRWVTRKEQARNRRNNNLVRFRNKKLCLSEWAEILKFPRHILANRLRAKWKIQDAFTRPIQKYVN